MKFKLIILFCSIFLCGIAQNPYTGKWKAYDIKSFKERDSVTKSMKNNFDSYIIFKEDMSFEKMTRGELTRGRYEFSDNKFKFLELDENGEYYQSWAIRWPKDTKDPSPSTPNIDLNYPEIFQIDGKEIELDVYYIKEK